MTPADVLAVLGLGLLGGQLGKRASRGAVLALPGGWLVGGLAGVAFPGPHELPAATALGVLAGGLLVAANARVPRGAFVALAVVLGALHGFVTGATTTAAGGDLLTLAGAVLAAFTLASLVPALVVGLREGWARIAVRVAGSWVAAIGLLMLAWLARSG
jgi:hydrogenase/urease accessory protein HupE